MDAALQRCGRYTLEREIGVGGMGQIFVGSDPSGQPVAIKRLLSECAEDPVFVGMFLDEARLAARLDHPNVCRVHEHGRDGRHYFLVMEYIDGQSLAQLLRTHRQIAAPLACRLFAEVATALDYAHRLPDESGRPLRIVHRDVSPANIMVTREGTVKLLDFGLAKARTQLTKTAPGMVKGKFGYLAPEQLTGSFDWRTDIFALGLCLFEALAGRMLFDQRTAAETVTAIRAYSGPPKLHGTVQGVSAKLDALLATALARSASKRFKSAAEVRQALAEVVRDLGLPRVDPTGLAKLVGRR